MNLSAVSKAYQWLLHNMSVNFALSAVKPKFLGQFSTLTIRSLRRTFMAEGGAGKSNVRRQDKSATLLTSRNRTPWTMVAIAKL
jgi:hypothetical protein